MCLSGLPTNTSPPPIFGVVTVKRMIVCVPGVIPPSCTLQKSAGRSSTRSSQLFCVAFASTIRSGSTLVSGAPLDVNGGVDATNGTDVGCSLRVQANAATAMTASEARKVERVIIHTQEGLAICSLGQRDCAALVTPARGGKVASPALAAALGPGPRGTFG